MKNIRNYTSSVPAAQSIARMEKLLIEAGARNITKQYSGDGVCEGLAFDLPFKGQMLQFKFSVNIKGIYNLFLKKNRRITELTKRNAMAQAERTAWKIECESLEITLSKIQLQMTELPQVLLGYLYNRNTDKTLYQATEEAGFKMLQ